VAEATQDFRHSVAEVAETSVWDHVASSGETHVLPAEKRVPCEGRAIPHELERNRDESDPIARPPKRPDLRET